MENIPGPFSTDKDGITYVKMDLLNTRQQCNKAIMVIIETIIAVYPDWRFQQVLTNIGIASTEDLFYEESRKTLTLLLENEVVKKYFKKYENKKAEVINFNDFKGSNKK